MNYGETEDRIYLNKSTISRIAMNRNECRLCLQFFDDIHEDDFGCYILKEQLSDERSLEHLRGIIAETTDNVAVHIMDGDNHVMRTMPAQAFFDMMHNIFG